MKDFFWWESLLGTSPYPGIEISLVGAGGKTTFLYLLAQEAAKRGFRTAVSTTTHIYYPTAAQSQFTVTDDNLQNIETALETCCLVTVGTPAGNGKLSAPSEAMFQYLQGTAEIILLESDGAKCLPVKVPRKGEPVLRNPQIVLAVCGISSLGRPLEKICHRAELAKELLRVPGDHCLTPEDIAKILFYSYGKTGNQVIFILNQADTETDRILAVQTAEILLHLGASQIVVASAHKKYLRKICR